MKPVCTWVLHRRRGGQGAILSVVGGVMLRDKTVALVQIVPMGWWWMGVGPYFVVEFFDDVVAYDWWGVACGGFVVAAQFETFMRLELIVCIGSYCFDVIFRWCVLWSWWGSSDVNVCANCCEWTAVWACWVWVEGDVEGECSWARLKV